MQDHNIFLKKNQLTHFKSIDFCAQTRWIPPAVAVRMRKFRPLQEPIRMQDLLNSARSRDEKKLNYQFTFINPVQSS